MSPIPVLFSHQPMYGDRILFGLLTTDGMDPVRIVAGEPMPVPSAARPLFGPQPEHFQSEPTTKELEILAVGDECRYALEASGQWMPLLMSMAQDMSNAVKGQRKLTPKQQAKADRDALMAKLGLPYDR